MIYFLAVPAFNTNINMIEPTSLERKAVMITEMNKKKLCYFIVISQSIEPYYNVDKLIKPKFQSSVKIKGKFK